MKDNLNIEKLFQEKFSSFEGEVSPDAWANIQQGMGATGAGAAASTGMSLLLKTALISGGIVAATFGGIYLFSDPDNGTEEINNPIVQVDSNNQEESVLNENDDLPTTQEVNSTEGVIELNQNNELNLPEEGEVGSGIDQSVNGSDLNMSEGQGLDQSNPGDGNSGLDSGDINDSADGETGNLDDIDEAIDNGGQDPLKESVKLPSGSLTFEPGDDYAPSTYSFHANAKDYTEIEWDFGNNLKKTGENVEHTFDKPGTYNVQMTVKGEGKNFVQNQEVIIKSKSSIDRVPNAFTPNGDRVNDFFMIFMTEIETFAITIRGAQGEIIFQSNDTDFRWYGTNQAGDRVDNGTYTYEFFAKGKDGSKFPQSGTIRVED